MPEIHFTRCSSDNVEVKAGALIRIDGVGVYLRAELNEPEFGGRPYVSVDTSELAPEHWYDEKTGRRGDQPPYVAGIDQLGVWQVVNIETAREVARFADEGFPFNPERAAREYARIVNEEWTDGRAGMPIISVHLNDGAEIYYDAGAGPTHPDAIRASAFQEIAAVFERWSKQGVTAPLDDVSKIIERVNEELSR